MILRFPFISALVDVALRGFRREGVLHATRNCYVRKSSKKNKQNMPHLRPVLRQKPRGFVAEQPYFSCSTRLLDFISLPLTCFLLTAPLRLRLFPVRLPFALLNFFDLQTTRAAGVGVDDEAAKTRRRVGNMTPGGRVPFRPSPDQVPS